LWVAALDAYRHGAGAFGNPVESRLSVVALLKERPEPTV
jgi:hypothetical protein